MKKILFPVILLSFFLTVTALPGFAASEHAEHHPGNKAAPTETSSGAMMGQMGIGMGNIPCMTGASSGVMMPMMEHGMGDMMGSGDMEMMGMMGKRMEHMFFLDRASELGLSADQVGKLKALQLDCRKDNIRTAAEGKVARLDLTELLSGDDWKLKDAETLIRKVQKFDGDVQVRHLQAIIAARKVLTSDQLKQARAAGAVSDNLDNLFQ